MSASPFKGRA